MDDLEALREPFARWLAERMPGAKNVRVEGFDSPRSGYSARTLFARVDLRRGDRPARERVVLRIESPEPPVYPVQAPGLDVEIEIQYRAMEALGGASDLPLAPRIGYEPDARVLGAPFFAVGFVEGDVPVEDPPYTRAGFFADASPAQRRGMLEAGLQTLARVHAIDLEAARLDWLVPPGSAPGAAAQLDLWEAYARRELHEREHPVFERGVAWLRSRMPRQLPPGVSWGDSRPGNIIWRDFRPVCLTDFENVAVAPAELDLGWWLMFDRCSHETVGAGRLPGEPTRAEQREIYAAAAPRPPQDLDWFEVLAALRYTAIVVRVMNRSVARGDLPPDQTIWRNNPAAACLEQLLDELA